MLKKYFIKLLAITLITSNINIHCMSENTKSSDDVEKHLNTIMTSVFVGIRSIYSDILSIDGIIESQEIDTLMQKLGHRRLTEGTIHNIKNDINSNSGNIKRIIETMVKYKDIVNHICLKYKSDIDSKKMALLSTFINSDIPETLEYFFNSFYPATSTDLLLKSGICSKNYEIIKYAFCNTPENSRFENGKSPLQYSESLGSDHTDVTNFIKNYENKIRFICKHNLIKKYNQYIAKQISLSTTDIIPALSDIISQYAAEPKVYQLSNDQIDRIINVYSDFQKEDCEKLS